LIIQEVLLYSVKKSFLFSSLFGLIVIIPLAYFLARSLTHPILEVTRKAIQLVSTTFDREVQVDSVDELGSLSKALSEMGVQLRSKIEEISKEKDYLQTILKRLAPSPTNVAPSVISESEDYGLKVSIVLLETSGIYQSILPNPFTL
jgi:nitrogen fixation/metabolism regulation signal transduction histidine kinase